MANPRPYPPSAPLHELARALRLSKMQKAFCERLVADPARLQGAAAIAAGAGAKSAPSRATVWMNMPKVQKYIAALEAAGIDEAKVANEMAGRLQDVQEIASRVTAMDAAEAVLIQSDMARVDMADITTMVPMLDRNGNQIRRQDGSLMLEPVLDWEKALAQKKTHLVKECVWTKEGDFKVKLIDKQAALTNILKMKGLLDSDRESDETRRAREAWRAFLLSQLPKETLAAMTRNMLAGGAIDITPEAPRAN